VYVFLSPGEVYTHGAAAALPHYTCGQTYFYPAFDAAQPEDAAKLAHELGAAIAMPLMLEAITRIRASKGQSLPPQRSLSH
jgi:protein transport protein SEC24